jgi:hypothetical protein
MEHPGELDPERGEILFRTIQAVSVMTGGAEPHLAGHAAHVSE